jgi:hypothetical protein
LNIYGGFHFFLKIKKGYECGIIVFSFLFMFSGSKSWYSSIFRAFASLVRVFALIHLLQPSISLRVWVDKPAFSANFSCE